MEMMMGSKENIKIVEAIVEKKRRILLYKKPKGFYATKKFEI